MISISDGPLLCVSSSAGVDVLRLDSNQSWRIDGTNIVAAIALSNQVWAFGRGVTLEVDRYTDSGARFGGTVRVPDVGGAPTIRAAADGSPAVVVSGTKAVELREDCDRLVVCDLPTSEHGFVPLAPRSWIAQSNGETWLRGPTRELCLLTRNDLSPAALLIDGHLLQGGIAVALRFRIDHEQVLVVLDLRRGGILQRISIEADCEWRLAQKHGHALLIERSRRIVVVDLRFGRILRSWDEPHPIIDLAVDRRGQHLIIEREVPGEGTQLVVRAYRDALSAAQSGTESAPDRGATPEVAPRPATPRAVATAAAGRTPTIETPRIVEAGPATVAAPMSARRVVEASRPALSPACMDPPLAGFSPCRLATPPSEDERVLGLESCMELIAAWCRRAIAEAWDTGRISLPTETGLPFQNETAAILDAQRGRAVAPLAAARQRAGVAEETHRDHAIGHDPTPRSPLAQLASELGLSELAAEILLVVAAPRLWGELARAYAIIANDASRAICDELLVGQILGCERASRRQIAEELDEDRPLVRLGVITVGGGTRPFSSLRVSDDVASRLWGRGFDRNDPDGVVALRACDRSLEQLRLADGVLETLVQELSRVPTETPMRLVVRGRLGSGRRTLLAALAARANRGLGTIDMSLLAQDPQSLPEVLRARLQSVMLRGWIPCVIGIELVNASDPLLRDQIREIFRSHPGPLTFCCGLSVRPPLDPGHRCVDLPPLSEKERTEVWHDSLERHALPTLLAEEMAARYSLGPGTIEQVTRSLVQENGATVSEGEASHLLSAAVRQHRRARIGDTATRIERLASWSNVVLPPELIDSLREFIGRIRYRKRVFEDWGFNRVITSARGFTALFQGGPGTGKSMVAGIIARELGYELYRVDLGRLLSKWIGETEKNLGALFDAAEEGDVLLLFDEADSLFSKRTEVRSSVDRYANIEVNYLLQRLDTFEGTAILTTNFGSAIDQAFKRRLSFRLTFPFPDEEMREQLWRVHLPPELPTAGELDFKDLATRYQLSGGYIRNATLRAAFLAAQEDRALTQHHLERAVKLEYREVGKIHDGGILE